MLKVETVIMDSQDLKEGGNLGVSVKNPPKVCDICLIPGQAHIVQVVAIGRLHRSGLCPDNNIQLEANFCIAWPQGLAQPRHLVAQRRPMIWFP